MENMVQKYVIYSSTRTGSTLVYQIMRQYCLKKLNYEHDDLFEFFVEGNKKEKFNFLLKNHDKNYLMKIMAHHIGKMIFQYFNENYMFICVERKNKLEQLLSHIIACYRKNWLLGSKYQGNMEFNNDQIICEKTIFDLTISKIECYYSYKVMIRNKIVIFYEDFEKINKLKILDMIGLSSKGLVCPRNLTEKIYKNKSNEIKNIDEVLSWCSNHPKIFREKLIFK